MKTRILFALVALFSASFAFGQDDGGMSKEKKERIKSMKVAFITQKVDFTPQEAEKFWPVYNEYDGEADKLQQERKILMRAMTEKSGKLTSKEAEDIVNNALSSDQQLLDLRKKYYVKYKTVLPVDKVARLYLAEELFKRELIQKMQDKRGGQGMVQGRRKLTNNCSKLF